MPRIEIGAGIVLAAIAPFGFLGAIPVAVLLLAFGILLILHGGYEEWIKPRFRVDQRLNDWLQRRGWGVRIERRSQFNFLLHITDEAGKQVVITRNKNARNDVLAFTGKVGIDPRWLPAFEAMSETQRRRLIQEITIFLATKNIAFDLSDDPLNSNAPVRWPPTSIVVQTALAQDHTLSQHSVDFAAKSIVHSMIGIRALIRKATLDVRGADDDIESSPTSSPESTPDRVPPQLRQEP
ncbi:MAG: DUF2299 family protein [Chloroflexi bacterium]|nr:DUF2299 family protein [Chloroflexota bacterium]